MEHYTGRRDIKVDTSRILDARQGGKSCVKFKDFCTLFFLLPRYS